MDRWITVITGTWYSGKGKVFRPKEMTPLPPGSVMYYPAYFVHYDGNQDGSETIGQIYGLRPRTDSTGRRRRARESDQPRQRRRGLRRATAPRKRQAGSASEIGINLQI
jgi:hypothetical protein